jgi:adenosylhomocysteine nucleosidase
VVGGSGVSGSVFLDNARFRRYLHDTLDADVVEMETAAIAMVAWANDVRFLGFRSVSDLAGGDAGANEMDTFMGLAAGNAARFLAAYLAARARQP